jgi:SAGA-associated factor 73
VDSEEETAAVMSALANWRPQPLVPQPVFMPIRKQYQLSRLHEQLNMATNGGRTNIFAVKGFGAQRMPEPRSGFPDGEDAPGEVDMAMAGFATTGTPSIGGSAPTNRPPSVISRG